MEKPEEHRNKWALGLAVSLSVIILISFAFYKGYLSFGSGTNVVAEHKFSDQVAGAAAAPTPIENSKETFKAAFDEINKQYQSFKDSISAVLVPFVTNIEVYKRE